MRLVSKAYVTCFVSVHDLLTMCSHTLGKLRCDHNMPCGRCLLRKSGSECVYTTTKDVPCSRRRPSTTVQTASLIHGRSRELEPSGISNGQQVSVTSASNSCYVQDFSTEDSGYLGHSSSSAVVQEINASLGYSDGLQAWMKTSTPSRSFSRTMVERGAQVLFELRNTNMLAQSLDRWLSIGDGYLIFRPVYTTWIEGLVEKLGPCFRSASSAADLYGLSAMVWQSSQEPLTATGDSTAREWALQATGHHLRWETVGLLLSAIGIMTSSLPPWDGVFEKHSDQSSYRTASLQGVMELVNECIVFCKELSTINDLFAVLLVGHNFRRIAGMTNDGAQFEDTLLLERTKGHTCKQYLRL